MRRLLMAVAVCALASGCLTSEVSRAAAGIAGDGGERHAITVDIENSGWYLFDVIPIFCGNPNGLDRCSTRVFCDTLSMKTNMDALARIMEREGTYVIGTLVSHEEVESFLSFVVTRHGYHTSATLMRGLTVATPAQ